MKIAYFTDTHIDEESPRKYGAAARENFEAVLDAIKLENPDHVVFGGDIGEADAYEYFFSRVSDFKQFDLSAGNHDKDHPVTKFFLKSGDITNDGLYYSFEKADFTWVFIDSSEDSISTAQLEWLGKTLQDSDKNVLLFIHHPILKIDSVVDQKYPLHSREVIRDLLLTLKKHVTIFCGHCHTEDYKKFENVEQYMTPAVSYQIKKRIADVESDVTYFSYRVINISGSQISTEVKNLVP